MGLIGDILKSNPITALVGELSGVIDKIIPDAAGKREFEAALQDKLIARDAELEVSFRAEIDAKQKIITAEIMHGDKVVRYARPSLIYGGLFVHIIAILGPMFGLAKVDIPVEFTRLWMGVCGAYIIGRSTEKRGSGGIVSRALSGKTTTALGL